MASGHAGTGLYSRQRTLRNSLRLDRNELANNDTLSPKDRDELADRIARETAQLKEVQQQIREQKNQR